MKITKTSILYFTFIINAICIAKCQEIDNITFYYSSSRRIPYSNVSIQINKSGVAYIHSEPAEDDPKWDYTKIDTICHINIEKFNYLKSKVILLENIELDKANVKGKDGNTCTIGYGAKGRNISYSFWSPEYSTKTRGLVLFLEICNEIITLVNLDPKAILDD